MDDPKPSPVDLAKEVVRIANRIESAKEKLAAMEAELAEAKKAASAALA